MEAVEQQKLGEYFLVLILSELKCVGENSKTSHENEDLMITPDSAKLGISSHFHLSHFYKALIISNRVANSDTAKVTDFRL